MSHLQLRAAEAACACAPHRARLFRPPPERTKLPAAASGCRQTRRQAMVDLRGGGGQVEGTVWGSATLAAWRAAGGRRWSRWRAPCVCVLCVWRAAGREQVRTHNAHPWAPPRPHIRKHTRPTPVAACRVCGSTWPLASPCPCAGTLPPTDRTSVERASASATLTGAGAADGTAIAARRNGTSLCGRAGEARGAAGAAWQAEARRDRGALGTGRGGSLGDGRWIRAMGGRGRSAEAAHGPRRKSEQWENG